MTLHSPAIASILTICTLLTLNIPSFAKPFRVNDGTLVKIRFNETVTSKTAPSVFEASLSVVDDILAEDGKTILIHKGSKVRNKAYSEKASKQSPGNLDITLRAIEASEKNIIPVEGRQTSIGKKSRGSVGGAVLGGLVLGVPGLIVGSRMGGKGKDIEIPMGTEVFATVRHDTLIFLPPFPNWITKSPEPSPMVSRPIDSKLNEELQIKASRKTLSKAPQGSLKIKVGVIMKSGDIKYGAQRPFYLLTKPMASIIQELYSKNLMSFESYLSAKNPSKELIDWMEMSEMNATKAYSGISMTETMIGSQGALAEAINVPEFRNFIDSGNWEKLPDYLKSPGDNYQAYKQKKYAIARIDATYEAQKYIIAECRTNFEAECTFTNMPSGSYYLTPIDNVEIGQNSVLWDYPVQIQANKQAYVELANHNLLELKEIQDMK